MKKSTFLVTALFGAMMLQAQDEISEPKKSVKSFNASIRTLNNERISGKLLAVNDSQVVLQRPFNKTYSISAENLKSLTIQRKNSVLRGALIGFGIGALTGAVIGIASGDDPIMQASPGDIWGIGATVHNSFAMTAGQKAVVGGIVLGVSGAIVGTVIGAVVKKKFTIGGKRERYRDLQAELMDKLAQK